MIPFTLERTVDPTMEPLTLEEVRDHLGIDHEFMDAWLDAKITEARGRLEDTGLACLTQTRRLKLLNWPCRGIITLPYPPLASVSSIAYTDPNGDSQTWSSADYVVNTAAVPGTIVPAYDEDFPDIRRQDGVYPITITYVCGCTARGDERLKEPRAKMLELIALWWKYREGIAEFGQLTSLTSLETQIIGNVGCYTEFDRALA